jgi:hypothetical protein
MHRRSRGTSATRERAVGPISIHAAACSDAERARQLRNRARLGAPTRHTATT